MKHIVITGSTRGIGFGLAKRFIEQGCKVTVNGTSDGSVNKALACLHSAYPDADIFGFAADVADEEAMMNLWQAAVMHQGKVDVWINNAGIDQERKYAWEVSSENYRKIVATNIIGVINGTKTAYNEMMNQGFGEIYNMEGFGSDNMMQDMLTYYGMTKRATRYFTQSFANEAKTSRVHIGTLSPGMVLTDFLLKPLQDKTTADYNRMKKVFNILADDVDTVTAFLSREILKNTKKSPHIVWLTGTKAAFRFMSAPFHKRKLIK